MKQEYTSSGKRITETPQELQRRVLRDAIKKSGVDLDDLDPRAQRILDRTGEPDSEGNEPGEPMGQRDRELLRIAEEKGRAAERAAVEAERFSRTDAGQAKQAEDTAWGTRSAAFCAKLGLATDDPRVTALAQRKWGSEADFWNAVAGLTGPGTATAQKATPQLDAALSELDTLFKSPGVGSPHEAEKRARKKELMAIVAELEKGQ